MVGWILLELREQPPISAADKGNGTPIRETKVNTPKSLNAQIAHRIPVDEQA
jgi:hypothetical protein